MALGAAHRRGVRHYCASAACFAAAVKRTRTKFVDAVRIQVEGGRGGRGVVSFEHLSPSKRRPIGGTGGRGGDVVLESSRFVHDLYFASYILKGGDGEDATGRGLNGRKGVDRVILVPCGTVVKEAVRTYQELEEDGGDDDNMPAVGYNDDGADVDALINRGRALSSRRRNYMETVTTLAELQNHRQRLVVARGGEPGHGNRHLRAHDDVDPEQRHNAGGKGEHHFLSLTLKCIADVGLVGFPNAGKSSFLRQISRASPKVAMYPFTTLHPILGVVSFPDTHTITVADLPGIIEGAHHNRGLGLEFLRHIERTKVLVYVLDACSELGPVHELQCLQEELRQYDVTLMNRPAIVLLNKMDLPGSADAFDRVRKATLLPVVCASAKDGTNVSLVVSSIRWLMDSYNSQMKQQRLLEELAATAAGSTDGDDSSSVSTSDDDVEGEISDDAKEIDYDHDLHGGHAALGRQAQPRTTMAGTVGNDVVVAVVDRKLDSNSAAATDAGARARVGRTRGRRRAAAADTS